MENASKALIMASSVLLAILIIGALVFMYSSLSNLKSTEATSEEVEKLAEYNKQIENFNRSGVYGSELLSLANLIDDYNTRQADLKGYQEIKLTINIINHPISGAKYMKANYNSYQNLLKDFNKLENEVNKWKVGTAKGYTITVGNTNVTADKISGMTPLALSELIKKANPNVRDIEIESQNLRDQAQIYVDLKTEMTEFKNKKFQTPEVSYDKRTGRIVAMTYTDTK